jgi:hypothetical protein
MQDCSPVLGRFFISVNARFVRVRRVVPLHFRHGGKEMPVCDIVQAAQDHLPKNFSSGVSCEYDAGVLVLRGRSRSYYEKQVAQEAVKRVDGVTRVVNEIEVIAESE